MAYFENSLAVASRTFLILRIWEASFYVVSKYPH